MQESNQNDADGFNPDDDVRERLTNELSERFAEGVYSGDAVDMWLTENVAFLWDYEADPILTVYESSPCFAPDAAGHTLIDYGDHGEDIEEWVGEVFENARGGSRPDEWERGRDEVGERLDRFYAFGFGGGRQ